MDVLVAELRTRSAPKDTVALEMSEHRGAVDVEASGELENRVAFSVCGNQPFDVIRSEVDLGLAVAGRELPGTLDLEVSSPLQMANSLVRDLNEVLAGFESRPIRSTRCRKHNVLAGNRPYFVSVRSPTLRVLLEPLCAPDPSDPCDLQGMPRPDAGRTDQTIGEPIAQAGDPSPGIVLSHSCSRSVCESGFGVRGGDLGVETPLDPVALFEEGELAPSPRHRAQLSVPG